MATIIEKLIKKIKGDKKEKLKTSNYAIIKLTNSAKQKGIEDGQNKEIHIFRDNRLFEIVPYFEGCEVKIREIDKIPIVLETLSKEEEFAFSESSSFGQTSRRRLI